MDAIDILGSILGHRSGKSGRGADILKDILRKSNRPKTSSRSTRSSRQPEPVNRRDLETQAKELEEMLNVANDQRSSSTRADSRTSAEAEWPDAAARSQPRRAPQKIPLPQPGSQEHALVLVRAMINAAKSDGQIDEAEQQKIIERLGKPTRENIDFLRSEFSKPLNLKEFVWSVPVGLEEQVYMISLITVDLDTGREAEYFMELAQGLRLPPDVREQIHERLGAPSIY